MHSKKIVAAIALYGNRNAGFAYLAHGRRGDSADAYASRTQVFGDYNPAAVGAGKLPNEDATSTIFAACFELQKRGIVGTARVSFDRKLPDGRTVVRHGDIEITAPSYFGGISWTEEVVDA